MQLQAKPFVYYEELEDENLMEYMSYKFDSNDSIETVLQKRDEFKPLKKSSFGFKTQTIWTQMEIKNPTTKRVNIALRNPNNLIAYIDIYIYQNDKLLKSYQKGFAEQTNSYNLFNRPNIVNLELPLKSTITIDYYFG